MIATDLSRLQFAVTALYHFLFVPLTLGLSVMLAIMESVYVMTGNEAYKKMTQFWGKLFGINFAMGVATGITMEFQFGTNWSYYSHYVGDIFGAPLAIEGLMAFFLESTFVGLFFFGWNKMTKLGHLTATWCVAIGTNLSALWILIANGWMQNPVGSKFNPDTMRMELESMSDIIFNPVAQAKFVHTISAGYVTGAVFVLAISCYYLLKNKHVEFAKRSVIIASSFGLLSAMCVMVLGDESGYVAGQNQKMKLAAMEAMWHTEPAPASFVVVGIPNKETKETKYAIKVPYAMGILATRSLNEQIPGIEDLVKQNEERIRLGIKQYEVLERYRQRKSVDPKADKEFLESNYDNIGYALLLKKFTNNIASASNEQIAQAANYTIPNVPVIFWTFRLMVGSGIIMLTTLLLSFYYMNLKRNFSKKWLLKLCIAILPLPWLAIEMGWMVAEYGRQPWAIDGILPTFLGATASSSWHVLASLTCFVVFYSILLIVDLFLMIKFAKSGPTDLPNN